MKFNKEHVAQTMSVIGLDGKDIPKSHAERYLDLALEGIITTLEQAKDQAPNKKNVRGKITIVGFGTFELRAVPEREHRNPQDPSQKSIKPAHNDVKLSIGSVFEELIN